MSSHTTAHNLVSVIEGLLRLTRDTENSWALIDERRRAQETLDAIPVVQWHAFGFRVTGAAGRWRILIDNCPPDGFRWGLYADLADGLQWVDGCAGRHHSLADAQRAAVEALRSLGVVVRTEVE